MSQTNRGLRDGNLAPDLFEQPAPSSLSSGHHYHDGHRLRLKERFANAGADALPDYELLELVLFSAIPRRDTKPIAKELLKRFNNSFAEVISAPPERLKEVKGVGDSAVLQLKLVRAAALRLMRGGIKEREVFGSWEAVLGYCRAEMGFETSEQFRILVKTH
jgi:DNA repair protein RadC